MFTIQVRANFLPGKTINDFLVWFEDHRDEQKRWGATSAEIYVSWFGGTHQVTGLYKVKSLDQWSAGQTTESGFEALKSVCQIVDPNSVRFDVLKSVPAEF